MDDIRDKQRELQKSDPLSRFFDKSIIRTNPFGENQSADLAYRRAERIVAALYLVTNHVSPEEQLRVNIRKEALQLLEAVLGLRNDMRAVGSLHVDSCKVLARRLISLVRVLAVSGNVSIQNSNVVVDSLDELGHFLTTSASSASSESVSFTRGDFSDVHAVSLKDIKDSHSVKDKSQIKDVANMSDTTALGTDLSVREQRILAILRSGGEVGIRDISSNLPEFSEKMIQRDLVRLVTTGRVKKTGLKRWSRYSVGK